MVNRKRGLFVKGNSTQANKEADNNAKEIKVDVRKLPKKEAVQEQDNNQTVLPIDQDRLMTVKEVANYFNVSNVTVYRWIYSKKLADVLVSGSRMIYESEFQRFARDYQPGPRGRRASR